MFLSFFKVLFCFVFVFIQVSQMSSLERELETIHLENEGLRKKQVRLDEVSLSK